MGAAIELSSRSRKFGTNVELELREFFGECESAIGLRSVLGAQLTELKECGTFSRADDFVTDPEGLVERIGHLGKWRRIWQTLKRMDQWGQHLELVCLHRLFGTSIRKTDIEAMVGGSSGVLATMTTAAGEARDDLAAQRGDSSLDKVRPFTMSVVDAATVTFWEKAPAWEKAARELADLRGGKGDMSRDDRRAKIAAAEAKVAKIRGALFKSMGPGWDDARVTYSTLAYADKTTSEQEGLLARLDDRQAPKDHAGKVAWHEERKVFLGRLRAECAELESRSRSAYLAAR